MVLTTLRMVLLHKNIHLTYAVYDYMYVNLLIYIHTCVCMYKDVYMYNMCMYFFKAIKLFVRLLLN